MKAPVRQGPPWWTRPELFVLSVILPIAVAICTVTVGLIDGNMMGYSAPVYLDAFYAGLFLSGIGLIALGAVLGRRLARGTGGDLRFRDGALDMLFLSCMAGYAIWFGPLLASAPDLIFGALAAQEGAVYEIRERAPNVSGVTTITQFGIAYACIFATKKFVFGEPLARRHDVFMALIIAAAIFRAVVYSERIAVIEVVFPLLVILCKGDRFNGGWGLRAFRQTLPLLMLIGSPLFFAAFEYNRSWINHYQYEYDSFSAFVLERMGLYYVTALNSMAGFMENTSWATFTGEWTLRWLYRLPLIGDFLSRTFATDVYGMFSTFLDEYAHEEFNNTTGILVAHHDWGVVGGSLFLAGYGVIAGLAFRSFRQSRGFLQYFYPIILYSLFEILRIGYLYDGRSIAALIGLAVAYVGWRVKGFPERTANALLAAKP